MIIKKLELKNFRRFNDFSIDFHEKLTVLVARNGYGKTSVLDGITMALGTFIGAFDLGKAKHIEKNDARVIRVGDQPESVPQYPVQLRAYLADPDLEVSRELTGPKNKTTIKDAHQITQHGLDLQSMVRNGTQESLPMVSYYGAGRLWKVHKNMERKQVVSLDRTVGYEDCLSPSSNFVQCQQWMAKATLARQQELDSLHRPIIGMSDRIEAIRDAVDHVLLAEGWSEFKYSFAHDELAMYNPSVGMIPVSLLSDGVRAMVSLVADIAFRCVRLNGHMGRDAPKKTRGIVLIDEVDIHLHPVWQQRVIDTLITAFPELQFIVTTHSPQVLTCVDAACIRIMSEESDDTTGLTKTTVKGVEWQTRGVSSSDLLARIMDVDPIPDVPEARWVTDYHALIQQGLHHETEAESLRNRLVDHFGKDHPVLCECDRMIRLQGYKSRFPSLGGQS